MLLMFHSHALRAKVLHSDLLQPFSYSTRELSTLQDDLYLDYYVYSTAHQYLRGRLPKSSAVFYKAQQYFIKLSSIFTKQTSFPSI